VAWGSMIDRLRGAPSRCSRGLPGLTFMAVGVFLFIACPKSVSSFPLPFLLICFHSAFGFWGFGFFSFQFFSGLRWRLCRQHALGKYLWKACEMHAC